MELILSTFIFLENIIKTTLPKTSNINFPSSTMWVDTENTEYAKKVDTTN